MVTAYAVAAAGTVGIAGLRLPANFCWLMHDTRCIGLARTGRHLVTDDGSRVWTCSSVPIIVGLFEATTQLAFIVRWWPVPPYLSPVVHRPLLTAKVLCLRHDAS